MYLRKHFFILFIFAFFALIFALPSIALTIPDKPSGYVNDYVSLLSQSTKESLAKTLLNFEKETSNQIVIAIFKSLEGESLEDFSIRLADKWKIGTKKKDNGVILLIFKDDRQVRIETGYGLEGALPDAVCNQIIRYEIVPSFKQGNFDKGVVDAVSAIINATKGEYKSDGAKDDNLEANKFILFLALMFYLVLPLLAYLVALFLCIQIFGFPLGLIIGIVCVIILGILRQIFFSSMFGQTLSSSGRGYFNNSGFLGGGFSGSGFGGGFSSGGGSFGGGGSSGGW